ncbi:MAG: DUF2589 domain-containing protein [Methanothrix sp.]|jgi:hypothetical protein|nr:DUF2589 domain-containing protein [Methanothrix sp.]
MASPGQELASIDFENLIGGPLIAVVHAQAQAAMATVNFVKQVGFKPPEGGSVNPLEQSTGEPATVTFKYKKLVPKADNSGDEEKTAELTVPFLAMLPIPYLRVQEVNIDFLAKINSVQFRNVDTNVAVTGELEAKAGWLWGSARLKVSSTYQRQTKEGSTETRDYSMNVKVKAVQEEMPGGLARTLTILESLIKEKVT